MNDPVGPELPLPLVPPPVPPLWEPPPVPAPQAPLLRPVPFEDTEALPGFWARVGGMFSLLFTQPLELFDRVPATDGLGAPWRFLLLLSVPVFLLVAAGFGLVGIGAMMAALEDHAPEGRAVAAFLPVIFGLLLLLLPLFAFVGMVIGGVLNHVFLWMWGGLRPGVGLKQTIRAYAYASAFLQIGGLIPWLGILIQFAGMVVIGIGLARMHKTDTWRGVCAALTPLVLVCCCGAAFLAMVLPALIASGRY